LAAADDDALMALVRARHEDAFATLVDRHLDAVHRYLIRLTGSPDDADELAQETFLRLWQKADAYRPGTVRLTTWLHRIAHNIAVDSLRRARPEPLEDSSRIVDDCADPARAAASTELQQLLDRAIAALPPAQRAALLLCQVQGFANRDAAAIMGVSVRSLESLLARARRTLRQRIEASESASS
jgi:RNA polymerase sigma-70 factor, ECF subfamily